MDTKDKLIHDALDLLNDIGFNHLQHDHVCYDDDSDDEYYQCYCGTEELLTKIAELHKRARLLSSS